MSGQQYPNPAMGPPPPSYNSAVNYDQYPQQQYGGEPTSQQPGYGVGQTAYGVPPPQEQGFGYAEPNPDPPKEARVSPDTDFFDDHSFSNKAVRRGFIRRVYLLLFAMLGFTFGITMLFSLTSKIKVWVQSTDGAIFYYVSYATFIVTYLVLICVPSVRRKSPGNFICLGVFTAVFTYMVATISSFYNTNSVMIAAGITTLVCLSITLFAIQTKIDFTMCAGLLFVLCMVLLLFGFSVMIVFMTVGYSFILDCVYGGLAALLFSLFLVYDTQMIVGGRKHELDPEEYVYGALQLYIDIVYIFLIILSFFGKSN